jgi:hypothetical protein
MARVSANVGDLPTTVVSQPEQLAGDAVEVVVGADGAVTALTTPQTSAAGRAAIEDTFGDVEGIAPSVAWHHDGADDPEARAELLAALLAGDGGES